MEEIVDTLRIISSQLNENKNIGVFCSGGFDSTTLLYTICFLIANKEVNIKVCTIPRHDNSKKHAVRVIKWLKKMFPQIKFEHVICGDPELHHSKQVLSGVLELLNTYPKTFFYLADTKIPDVLKNEHSPIRNMSMVNNLVQPFFDYEKTFVIQLANYLNVLEQISLISHTCTEKKNKRCKKCWQCIERNYSFTQLNLIDVGQM